MKEMNKKRVVMGIILGVLAISFVTVSGITGYMVYSEFAPKQVSWQLDPTIKGATMIYFESSEVALPLRYLNINKTR